MRLALLVFPLAALTGCGYPGEPKPPALMRPARVTDLAAVERDAKIVVTFTLPRETTEGIVLTSPPDVELRIGSPPAVWNEGEWVGQADRIPVPPMALSSDKAAAEKAGSNQAAPEKPEPVTIRIDVSKYVGKPVVVGVRVHGPKGRDDGWSNLVPLEIVPPLPAPADLRAADGPNLVRLQWAAGAPEFRVFRKLQSESEWTSLGSVTQPSYNDSTFDYGKTYQYYVQAARKTGSGVAESEVSGTITFEPHDRFPPAIPANLAAVAGARTIELVWDRVTDSDLAGYRVYRNGQRIADAVVTPAYGDKDAAPGVKYRYEVSSVDQAGNESEKSAAVEAVME
jgi:hypothetical protein